MTSEQSASTFSSIGIDIGKEIFHIVAFDAGKIVLRKKIERLALEKEFDKMPPSIVELEALLSTHFVSRVLRRLPGHEPGLCFRSAQRRAATANSMSTILPLHTRTPSRASSGCVRHCNDHFSSTCKCRSCALQIPARERLHTRVQIFCANGERPYGASSLS
jgi:hypothetical protein